MKYDMIQSGESREIFASVQRLALSWELPYGDIREGIKYTARLSSASAPPDHKCSQPSSITITSSVLLLEKFLIVVPPFA